MRIHLTVNDRKHDVEVAPRKTLADTLREDCGLTGTHVGCEQGVCGSCTVLYEGEPVRSCLIFAVQCDGARIRTVEGMAADDATLHPVQEAFRRHGALQCGFCTPGFVMLLAGALPDLSLPADEERLREIVSSNLCRCTGYRSILAATLEAVEMLRTTEETCADQDV